MQTPVLVAGGGPVGLALAGDLGMRGIPCSVIERRDGSVTQPKMDLIGIRTMELCRRWGIVDWVENAGYNREHPQDYAWVSALSGGYEFGREPFPPPKDEPTPPYSPQHRERQPQNFFDPVIARFAKSFAHVQVRYKTEFVRFEERPDSVLVEVRDVETGRSEQIEAQYLIGADGGGSQVREQLGIRLPDAAVLTYTTNAIFRSPNLWDKVDIKPGYRFIFIGPQGTWCTIVAIDGRDNYRFSFVGDMNKRALTEPELRDAICKALGTDIDFEILSVMPWIRREFVADRYGSKRVFLLGDAARLNSPTGAFGMNTGMQDAADMGWKLAAVLQGWGGPKLLASFEAERRPVAMRNVKEATANLKRMMSPSVTRPPENLLEPGPSGARARREFGESYTDTMKHEWFADGIHLGYRYEGSPVIVPDGTPEPPDTVTTYTQTARPGHRAPHAWLADGKSTLDLFSRTFSLLRFGRCDSSNLEAAARARHMPISVHDVDNAEAAQLYERRLVLVRPDGHVAWRGDEVPGNVLNIIDTVRGA